MTDTTSLQESLKSALQFERTGHDYYAGVAEKAMNPLTKDVFASLAEQEIVHMKRIREICESLKFEGASAHGHAPDMQLLVKAIFDRFKAQERYAWEMDNSEAYEYAEDLERKSIAMYDRLAADSTDPVEKQFFQQLSREEHEHLNALENVYFYLRRTGDWFASEEDRVWNWMNT